MHDGSFDDLDGLVGRIALVEEDGAQVVEAIVQEILDPLTGTLQD